MIACVVAGRDIFAEFNDPRLWDDLKCNDEIISRLPETISANSAWASQILKNTLRLKPSDRFNSTSKILVSLTDIEYYSLEHHGLTSRIDSVNYLSSGRQNLPSSSFKYQTFTEFINTTKIISFCTLIQTVRLLTFALILSSRITL